MLDSRPAFSSLFGGVAYFWMLSQSLEQNRPGISLISTWYEQRADEQSSKQYKTEDISYPPSHIKGSTGKTLTNHGEDCVMWMVAFVLRSSLADLY